VLADNTYRYEHYTNWREHVSVIVSPTNGGWAVTAWSKAEC
jgi:hypothetical protein